MIAERYVLLACVGSFLLPWSTMYVAFPRQRRVMLWSSVFAVPFGISEPLFAGTYWSPPSLFDLARRAHLDVESFIFLFFAGGIASTAYNAVTGNEIVVIGHVRQRARLREVYNAGLAMPVLVFPLALLALRTPIRAAVVALAAGAIARIACRPDLLTKTLVGALLFCALYLVVFTLLLRAAPSYVDRYWSHGGGWMRRVRGVPIAEYLFGFSFGAYWSRLYEHWHWTFARSPAGHA